VEFGTKIITGPKIGSVYEILFAGHQLETWRRLLKFEVITYKFNIGRMCNKFLIKIE
jgi:hypothetical protein